MCGRSGWGCGVVQGVKWGWDGEKDEGSGGTAGCISGRATGKGRQKMVYWRLHGPPIQWVSTYLSAASFFSLPFLVLVWSASTLHCCCVAAWLCGRSRCRLGYLTGRATEDWGAGIFSVLHTRVHA